MSADDFKRSGLHKLDAEELAFLDHWLGELLKRATQPAQSKRTSEEKSQPKVIESRIDGEFEGWDGETLFLLVNGQLWQQSEFDYTYHYAFSPEVLIVRTERGWVLRVEGVAKNIRVERLK